MASQRLPTLFISHGSPLLAIDDSAARRFLSQLGAHLPRPTTIVVLSAHHDAEPVEITSGPHPATIHDFGGFPRELYELRYPAPGAPELAARIHALLSAVDIDAALEPSRGFDHGAWIPLLLMYPAADLPLVQVSIDSSRDAAWHFALGRALRPLRENGVLLIGSGGATHNLGLYMHAGARGDGAPPPEWVARFNDWVAEAIDQQRHDDLLQYRERAPYVEENHPTHEHFLPLFAALGAARDDERGERIHASYDRGLLSLDSYAFGGSIPSSR
jgi:4,5-DOPA dioxygenase extradiol